MGNTNKWGATNWETKTNIVETFANTFDASTGGTITGNLQCDSSLIIPGGPLGTAADTSTFQLVFGVTGDMSFSEVDGWS